MVECVARVRQSISRGSLDYATRRVCSAPRGAKRPVRSACFRCMLRPALSLVRRHLSCPRVTRSPGLRSSGSSGQSKNPYYSRMRANSYFCFRHSDEDKVHACAIITSGVEVAAVSALRSSSLVRQNELRSTVQPGSRTDPSLSAGVIHTDQGLHAALQVFQNCDDPVLPFAAATAKPRSEHFRRSRGPNCCSGGTDYRSNRCYMTIRQRT